MTGKTAYANISQTTAKVPKEQQVKLVNLYKLRKNV
jgi:hypothetical protein